MISGGTIYSLCEPVTAHSYGPWHIRALGRRGKMLGGGADTKALCGATVSWDLSCPDVYFKEGYSCLKCWREYERVRDGEKTIRRD